ncbi:glycosyltransferase [Vibrio diabolicus]|uniref:glycosyltransferase n=1 Tax=Vibrio diabolicus TaxID=50719 RepID=UPI0037519097
MIETIMLVAPGFYKKTGYYFRAIRDKDALERNGHKVTIIGFKFPYCLNSDGEKVRFRTALSSLFNSDRIISENIAPSLFAFPFFNKHRVMVVHGSLEDLKPFKFYFFKKKVYSFLLKYALRNYDSIISVSNAMSEYLRKLVSKDIENIITIPNLPDDDFLNNVENAINLKDYNEISEFDRRRKYICYCGNSQKWQKIDFLLDVFSFIHKNNDDIDLLILTKDIDSFSKEITKRGINTERVILKSVKNTEVPKYLVASHLLYLLRDNDEINNVACPTKAMEYLASGSEIIVSKGLGDISDLVELHNRGILVDLDSIDDSSIVGDLIIQRIKGSTPKVSVDIDDYRLSNYDKEYQKL